MKRATTICAMAVTVTASVTLTWTPSARAADAWVERRETLPARNFAFDLGLGLGHVPRPAPQGDVTGGGANFEFAVSPIHHLELGLRTGARFGQDGKATGADRYARIFDHETFGTGGDAFANPEFRIRGELVDVEVFELALEGRLALPFENGTRVATEFGVPLAIHIGTVARIDTGLFIPVGYYDPIQWAVDVPVDLWFQVTQKLWLGPRFGIRHTDFGSTTLPNGIVISNGSRDDLLFGFGLGYQVASFVDLKTHVLFPAVNHDQGAQTFGAGFAVQLRIE